MGKFILYDYDKNKGYQNPAITITRNGTINFNIGMIRKFIKNKDYVVLYYDKTDGRMGFDFLSEESKKGFKIKKSDKGNIGIITGRSFLNFYNIPYIKTNRYQAKEDKDTGYIVINLKKRKG